MKKNKPIIPLYQILFLIIFLFLIIARILVKDETLVKYINIVNYISMIVSFAGVWFATIYKSKVGRNLNICKAIFVIISVFLVLYGCWVFFLDKMTSSGLNDIFTLAALMFCICNIIFEKIIFFVFRLEQDDSKE